MRIVLAVLCLLVFAAPATAATPPVPLPAGATFSVTDSGPDKLTLKLNAGRAARDPQTGDARLWPDERTELDVPISSEDGPCRQLVEAGAGRATVATVE